MYSRPTQATEKPVFSYFEGLCATFIFLELEGMHQLELDLPFYKMTFDRFVDDLVD